MIIAKNFEISLLVAEIQHFEILASFLTCNL